MSDIIKAIEQSIRVKQDILGNPVLIESIRMATEIIIGTFRNKGRVLLCGNGGSAADAQHIAAELSGRFTVNRPPLDAEALHVNTSYITAVANDFSFDEIYSRAVLAFGRPGDALIAISTSGNSANIVKAAQTAQKNDIQVIGLTGSEGGQLASACKLLINVPSRETAKIQEAHIMIGHIICDIVEKTLFPVE